MLSVHHDTQNFVFLFKILEQQIIAALIIESKNPENLKILAVSAKQLGDNVKPVDLNDIEDLFLGKFMDKIKTGKSVSKATIMKTLGVKR